MSRELPPEDLPQEPADAEREPTILPTPPRLLVVAALFGGVVGWFLGPVVSGSGRTPMYVPWTAPAALVLAALVLAVMARRMHQAVHVRHEVVDPQRGLYSLVLGKSAALVGAAVLGGYLVFGASFLPRLEADAALARVVGSALAALAGAGLGAAGYALERACRVPNDSGPDGREEGRGSGG